MAPSLERQYLPSITGLRRPVHRLTKTATKHPSWRVPCSQDQKQDHNAKILCYSVAVPAAFTDLADLLSQLGAHPARDLEKLWQRMLALIGLEPRLGRWTGAQHLSDRQRPRLGYRPRGCEVLSSREEVEGHHLCSGLPTSRSQNLRAAAFGGVLLLGEELIHRPIHHVFGHGWIGYGSGDKLRADQSSDGIAQRLLRLRVKLRVLVGQKADQLAHRIALPKMRRHANDAVKRCGGLLFVKYPIEMQLAHPIQHVPHDQDQLRPLGHVGNRAGDRLQIFGPDLGRSLDSLIRFPMVTCPAGRLGSGIRTTEGLM